MRPAALLRRLLLLLAAACALAPAPARARTDAPWRAQWVWLRGAEKERNFYLYARRAFTLTAVPKRAPARITADTRYRLWVNGRAVGRGPARSDPAWLYYDSYDLAPYLRSGRNVVAVLVDHYGEGTMQYIPAPAGLLFEADCGPVRLATDASWHVRRADAYRQDAPKMDFQLPASEEFDARKEPTGWTRPDYDDSGWEAATVLGPATVPPHTHLIPRDIPHLREEEVPPARRLGTFAIGVAPPELADKSLAERMQRETLTPMPQSGPAAGRCVVAGPTALVYDFGREMLGFPRLRVTAPAGTTVDLGYSETLEKGRVVPFRSGVRYADRLVCRDGTQEYEVFTPRGFRYLQLDVRPPGAGGPVVVEKVAQDYATYPVEYRGSFECSDPTLNAVWKLGRYTVQQCMEDAYTDCPWRERGQWWGDARAEAFTTYYAFGDARLIRKAILQISQSQRDDGMTMGVWPAAFDNPLPDFCLIWVMTLDDYVRFTGDLALARQLYPQVEKALKWFDKQKDVDGLLRNVPHWVFIDWADLDKAGACTALNAYYVGACRAAQRLADRLGISTRVWTNRADRVAAAINAHLWSEAEGAYVDALHDDSRQSATVSEQANALCVLYGIADAAKQPRIFARLAEQPNTEHRTPNTKTIRCGSPYFSFYWLWAMHTAGRHAEAVDYVRRHWKVMLDAGATTAWEMWNPDFSLCHGWSSGPTSLLPAWVLGVRPVEDGMRRVLVAPQPGDLWWARGVVPTPRGPLKVWWQRKNVTLTVTVQTPPGVTAEVVTPADHSAMYLNGSGRKAAGLKPRADGYHFIVPGGRRFTVQAHETAGE